LLNLLTNITSKDSLFDNMKKVQDPLISIRNIPTLSEQNNQTTLQQKTFTSIPRSNNSSAQDFLDKFNNKYIWRNPPGKSSFKELMKKMYHEGIEKNCQKSHIKLKDMKDEIHFSHFLYKINFQKCSSKTERQFQKNNLYSKSRYKKNMVLIQNLKIKIF